MPIHLFLSDVHELDHGQRDPTNLFASRRVGGVNIVILFANRRLIHLIKMKCDVRGVFVYFALHILFGVPLCQRTLEIANSTEIFVYDQDEWSAISRLNERAAVIISPFWVIPAVLLVLISRDN